MSIGGHAAERLRSLIERIERLEEEKAALASDIAEVYAEAKATGFDTKVMRAVIKLRRMTETEREEHDGLLDLYRSALGMYADTPLGEAALRRFKKPPPGPGADPGADPAANPGDAPESAEGGGDPGVADSAPVSPRAAFLATTTREEAAALGKAAAEDGKSVTDNPFPSGDSRRATWDTAWCLAAGSDGMDIPEAWRRQKPPAADAAAPEGAAAPPASAPSATAPKKRGRKAGAGKASTGKGRRASSPPPAPPPAPPAAPAEGAPA